MNVWLGDSWWQCCLCPLDCTSHQHCCHVVGGGFPQAHRDIVTIPALLSQCHHYPPPPPAGSSQCHCFAGGGQNLRAQPGHTPSPPKLSSPLHPPLMHTALTKLFLLFPSPPAPFGTQMGGEGLQRQ